MKNCGFCYISVEAKPAEEEWQPFIPTEPSAVLQATYGKEPGTFWASMGDFDAGNFIQ